MPENKYWPGYLPNSRKKEFFQLTDRFRAASASLELIDVHFLKNLVRFCFYVNEHVIMSLQW